MEIYVKSPKQIFKHRAQKVPKDVHPDVLKNKAKNLQCRMSFDFVFDYVNFKFTYVSKSFESITQGYQAADLVNNDYTYFEKMLFPADIPKLCLIYQKWNEYFLKIPPEERKDCLVTFDYRILSPKGTTIRLLQQNKTFDIDTHGNLIFSFGTCTDISHWKKNGEIVLSILGPTPKEAFEYYPVFDISDKIFTPSEKRILKLLYQGASSKEIASQLFISVDTVNTHRRNMLRKAKVKNTTELVKFAVDNQLI